MQIGILSDTHDQMERTRLAVQSLQDQGAEVLIHCGDLTSPEIVSLCAVLPCYFVFGNHDADSVPTLQQAIEDINAVCLGWGGEIILAEKKIAVTHGHTHFDVRKLLANHPDYLFSGHSHLAADWMVNSTRRINPGALHQADVYSVALLDLESGDLQSITLS